MKRVIAYHGRCFDGAFSAALMTELLDQIDGPADGVMYVPLAHQKGQGIDPAVLSADVNAVVDFKYSRSPNLTWWFDHHQSAFISDEHRQHFEARQPAQRYFFSPEHSSCAKLIYQVATQQLKVPMPDYGETLLWADIIDSAGFRSAREAVELKHPALQLMTYIEGSDNAAVSALIPRFGRESLAEIVSSDPVQTAFAEFFQQHQQTIDKFKQKARLSGSAVFADLSDSALDGFNKFIVFSLFPEAVYSVVVTSGATRSKVSVGSNPWRAAARQHNIAKLCEPFGGGGHAVVGAVTLPPGHADDARQVANQIVEQLERPSR